MKKRKRNNESSEEEDNDVDKINPPPKKKRKVNSENIVGELTENNELSNRDLLKFGKLLYSKPYELEYCSSYESLSESAKISLDNLKSYLDSKNSLIEESKIEKNDWVLFEKGKIIKKSKDFNEVWDFSSEHVFALLVKVGYEFKDQGECPQEWKNFENESDFEENDELKIIGGRNNFVQEIPEFKYVAKRGSGEEKVLMKFDTGADISVSKEHITENWNPQPYLNKSGKKKYLFGSFNIDFKNGNHEPFKNIRFRHRDGTELGPGQKSNCFCLGNNGFMERNTYTFVGKKSNKRTINGNLIPPDKNSIILH